MTSNHLLQGPATLRSCVRHRLRALLFAFVRKVAATDDGRTIFSEMLRTEVGVDVPRHISGVLDQHPPYRDLGSGAAREERCGAASSFIPIFVTGRFRSGSTLFWNLFRNLPNTTSYYEPHNERRWFEPSMRGTHVDPTHLNVESYWAEYEGLDELGKYYRDEWIDKRLYMSDRAWDPDMQKYIEVLINRAKGRAVLQFNHVDLRLPWLRACFPQAKILHVYRHPRDQWCSTLRGFNGDMKNLTLKDFQGFDGFYLLSWAKDLRHYFPFIDLSPERHPYEVFYQIWKLSYLFGRSYADVSIAYEALLANPAEQIDHVLRALGIVEYDLKRLAALVSPVETGKWKKWACDSLFAEIETQTDSVLNAFFSQSSSREEVHISST